VCPGALAAPRRTALYRSIGGIAASGEAWRGRKEDQDSVAKAIAQGVEDFLGDRNRLAKVV
jgi:hypothetical protein